MVFEILGIRWRFPSFWHPWSNLQSQQPPEHVWHHFFHYDVFDSVVEPAKLSPCHVMIEQCECMLIILRPPTHWLALCQSRWYWHLAELGWPVQCSLVRHPLLCRDCYNQEPSIRIKRPSVLLNAPGWSWQHGHWEPATRRSFQHHGPAWAEAMGHKK